ncbi:MAG: TetR/AcrR family transcriptional regulator [Gammaproteobacteria bacterium]
MSMERKTVQEFDFEGLIQTGKRLSRAGRATVLRILEAAFEILRTEGYEHFSMQAIGRRLDMRLSNVQYYFKSRGDLIRALMCYVQQSYIRRYRELLHQAGDSPEGRFRALLEFNFEDIGDDDTRHFFIQLWPLLSSTDDYTGELMQQLYETQLQYLSERIHEMVPDISLDEARIRAEIIAAMFEGFMVTAPASVDTEKHRRTLKEAVIRTAFSIARGGAD